MNISFAFFAICFAGFCANASTAERSFISNRNADICVSIGETCNFETQDCCQGVCSVRMNTYLHDGESVHRQNVSMCEGKFVQRKSVGKSIFDQCIPPTGACSWNKNDCCNGECIVMSNVASKNHRTGTSKILEVSACAPSNNYRRIRSSRLAEPVEDIDRPKFKIAPEFTLTDGVWKISDLAHSNSAPKATPDDEAEQARPVSTARAIRTLSRRDKAWCAGSAQLCDIRKQDCCKGMCGHYHFVPLCEVKEDSID